MTKTPQRSQDHEQAESLRSFTERRRSPRIRACDHVLLIWEESQQKHQERAFTISISRFGCTLLSHRFFRPGAHARLKRNDKIIAARVAYCLPDRLTNLIEVGLEFDPDGQDFWENPGLG